MARSAQPLDSGGVLVLDLGGERQVLQPVSGSRAFTFGLGGVLPAIGNGDSVTALGSAGFTYLGVRYRRVGS